MVQQYRTGVRCAARLPCHGMKRSAVTGIKDPIADLLADAGTVTAVVSDVYTGNATAKWDRKPNEITKVRAPFRSQRLLPRATLVQKVQTAH